MGVTATRTGGEGFAGTSSTTSTPRDQTILAASAIYCPCVAAGRWALQLQRQRLFIATPSCWWVELHDSTGRLQHPAPPAAVGIVQLWGGEVSPVVGLTDVEKGWTVEVGSGINGQRRVYRNSGLPAPRVEPSLSTRSAALIIEGA